MIKFENLKVYNIVDAMRGMRNPMESWHLNDSGYGFNGQEYIGPKDLKLAQALSKAGNDHAKYLRQIFVSVDIIAPMYFFKEHDTYKVATVANSTSMMHKLGSRLLTIDDFSMEDMVEEERKEILAYINTLIQRWWNSGKKKPSKEWRAIQQIIPSSFMYRRTWTANYQVLKTIALSDRRNHKLQEWRDFINYFIDNAPYFKELCVEIYKEK